MFLLPETRNCDNFLQKPEKLKHIFRTFGSHSRKLVFWENIDQLCPTAPVGLVEEKPLGDPRSSRFSPDFERGQKKLQGHPHIRG